MAKRFLLNSFFAGIGGFDIGFERQGFRTNYLCEINPYCQAVLATHWPEVRLDSDICSLDSKNIPVADVWCGGFPCQDISVARGSAGRKGLKGERSGLFYQYANLIEKKQPQVVVIENVEGLFNSNGGRDLGVILQRMTGMGYAVAWRQFNSRYFGVPQSRSRIYICCWKNDLAKATRVMFEAEVTAKLANERRGFLEEDSIVGSGYPKVPKVAYCLAATSGRHTGTDWSRTYITCKDGVRRMTPKEYERLQGFPDAWTVPAGYDIESEDTDTLRYTAIGNAVSVPVVEWVAKRVYAELSSKRTRAQEHFVQKYIPEFNKAKWSQLALSEIDFSDEKLKFQWPRSGIAWKDAYIGVSIPPSPSKPIFSSLGQIVERSGVGRKYYLTPNAAKGILRRVDGQGRTLFAPLRVGLEKESRKQVAFAGRKKV